jgi:hypothetical protein
MESIQKNPGARLALVDTGVSGLKYDGPEHASTRGTRGSHATTAAEAPAPSVPDFTSMSPASLMAYCESQLNNLDSQMQGIFSSQQKNASMTQTVSTIANSLGDLPPKSTNSTSTLTVDSGDTSAIDTQYAAAITQAGKGTVLGIALANDKAKFDSDASGGSMTTDQVASLTQNLKNDTTNLNGDSQMAMINLQSLMSQRETAVQLSTNLIQSLGQQSSDITKNVGQ